MSKSSLLGGGTLRLEWNSVRLHFVPIRPKQAPLALRAAKSYLKWAEFVTVHWLSSEL